VQVGNMDFNKDLLLYNRELSCLVAARKATGGSLKGEKDEKEKGCR